ncbi:allantoinase AllB [Rhizobiaceae bacterium BDR2-2]|uniref:D-hydantoinase n=1 Tax=Ectorhizobium quercum TaxID=2965071 RepID=A0AAE3N342_9HYPH|nr:allantoinase AllB [Ectorhizobium quercum]MCX8999709.1 allantoinase AllB [Ectorhizobium quercum]
MDTLIKGGTVVTEHGVAPLDIGIAGGRVAALLSPGEAVDAGRIVDATGLLVVAGAIDAHVHFTGSNPYPEEELFDGTCSAAMGGVTTIIEMPHSNPPATTLEAFEAKKAMAMRQAVVDFGLWGGLDGRNCNELPRLREAGALAFKGFLCSSQRDRAASDPSGLPALTDAELVEAMRVVGKFGGLIGLHAENHDLLIEAQARLRVAGRTDMRAHAEAGPEIAEIEAVSRIITLSRETGTRCHIVHLSSGKAAELIAAAKGTAPVSVETCSHYLLLDEDDLVRIGPWARCGPPLRPRETIDLLWTSVLNGTIDILASDHCPYLPEAKSIGFESVWKAGMGLTGVQTTVPLLFSEGVVKRGLSLTDFARMTAAGPARLFGLYPKKGTIAPGSDADLVFYRPDEEWTITGQSFPGRAKWTPFEGTRCTGRVVRTMVRGTDVYADGTIMVSAGFGTFQHAACS